MNDFNKKIIEWKQKKMNEIQFIHEKNIINQILDYFNFQYLNDIEENYNKQNLKNTIDYCFSFKFKMNSDDFKFNLNLIHQEIQKVIDFKIIIQNDFFDETILLISTWPFQDKQTPEDKQKHKLLTAEEMSLIVSLMH